MEILEITIPALLVLLTAYLLINKMLKNEENRRDFELRKSNLSVVTPIQLRAYERLILLLERTAPEALILNTAKVGMTNLELQTQLLANIRQEFAHNYSQQIYISDECWKYIRSARESLLQLVNACATQLPPNESATQLAERIIQVYSSSENTPTELAIEKLKIEVRMFY